jgi:cytochrome c biogenesis protein CcdA
MMNSAHLHLVLTHFPPVLSLGGAFSAAAGLLLRRRRDDLIRLALVLLVVVGAMMPIVYIAGNRTAERIGREEGVQQEAIAPHQRAATVALATSVCAGFLAGGLLIIERRRGSLSRWIQVVAVAAAFATALPIGWAAALGGAIHHPEISDGVFSPRR